MSGWKTGVVTVVLALSLLGNAVALGAGLRLYRLRQEMLGDSAGVTLPRSERRDLVAALVAHASEMRPAMQAVQTARRDAVLAITAKPYDAGKTSAALDALRGALGALMQQGQAVVLDDLKRRAGG